MFYINHHDLTSSLNTLNHKNAFLKFKSKLFGVESKNMIKKKVKVKITTLNNLIKKNKIKKLDRSIKIIFVCHSVCGYLFFNIRNKFFILKIKNTSWR